MNYRQDEKLKEIYEKQSLVKVLTLRKILAKQLIV